MPDNSVPGFIRLQEVVEKVGRRLCGDDWTGRETRQLRTPAPSRTARRLEEAVDCVRELLASSQVSAVCVTESGAILEIDSAVWRSSEARRIFDTGLLAAGNLRELLEAQRAGTLQRHVFLQKNQLEEALRTKLWPSRPESCPRNFEWLPDVIERHVSPRGEGALERVRLALAEGDVVAIVETLFGERFNIYPRMWRKHPRSEYVLPRFTDGRLKMTITGGDRKGAKVEGWIFVPKGSLQKVLSLADTGTVKGDKAAASQTPQTRKRGPRARAKEAAMRALTDLYPDGIPNTPWKTITGEVNAWLHRRKEMPVSEDTVRRAVRLL